MCLLWLTDRFVMFGLGGPKFRCGKADHADSFNFTRSSVKLSPRHLSVQPSSPVRITIVPFTSSISSYLQLKLTTPLTWRSYSLTPLLRLTPPFSTAVMDQAKLKRMQDAVRIGKLIRLEIHVLSLLTLFAG